jgi:hypothetical protein
MWPSGGTIARKTDFDSALAVADTVCIMQNDPIAHQDAPDQLRGDRDTLQRFPGV